MKPNINWPVLAAWLLVAAFTVLVWAVVIYAAAGLLRAAF